MNTTAMASATGPRLGFDPYTSLRYHFGMLLGVEDLEVEQAYHRGKQWVHNAWLHGEGVVWGLGVSFDAGTLELRVDPGLALDAAGRELYLPHVSCVNLGAWFDEHRDESAFGFSDTASGTDVTVRVVIRFDACLERPVPAISETCTNATSSTAYSRARELPRLELAPATEPIVGDPVPRSHLVRLLFGLEDPAVDETGAVAADDQDVLDTLASIAAMPAAPRGAATLEAIRTFAARDVATHGPPSPGGHLPVEQDTVVVLAEVAVTALDGSVEAGWTVGAVDVDNDVRPTLLSTRAIQELLAGRHDAGAGSRLRVDRSTVARTAPDRLELELVGEALVGSMTDAVEVVAWNDAAEAWRTFAVSPTLGAAAGDPARQSLTVDLGEATDDDDLLRIVVRGTGPTPLLGTDHLPLAGGTDGPPVSVHDGHDFVHMARAADLDA